MTFGGLKTVWITAMFDLPVDTKKARKAYREFREALLADGFRMMQYSVYVRHCPSDENMTVHKKRIKLALPPDGEVRIVTFTDLQFERMEVFYGPTRGPTEKPPEQLTFL